MPGRMIAVVGPSGVGKDSLIAGLMEARADLFGVRRVITRDVDAGGEAFEAVSRAHFMARVAEGDFALHWEAHGLSYGIPACVCDRLARGEDGIVNLSRTVLPDARAVFAALHVLSVTARPEVLEARLRARARESDGEIAHRLRREVPDWTTDLIVTEIDNSGPLEGSVAAALRALYPVRA